MIRKLLLILIFFGAALTAEAEHPKVAKDAVTDGDAPLDVIVQFNNVPGAQHADKIARYGGNVKTDLSFVNSLHASIPANRLEDLANDPDVKFISPDRPVQSSMYREAIAVNAPYAWSLGYTGSGITIAVVDSGIGNVDDLKDSSGAFRVVYAQDFIGGGTDDQWGHGTHVAGAIGGTGKRSSSPYCKNCIYTFKGIAPDVRFCESPCSRQEWPGDRQFRHQCHQRGDQPEEQVQHSCA